LNRDKQYIHGGALNPWINYHHLYYFKTIAEEKSVSRAAEKLRLGQPTLSAQLKQFESALGVALFERQHKKLTLTEQGRIAFDYARNIFKMGSEMYEVLHDRHVPQRLSLTIGALDSIAKQVVLNLTERALKISPCQISLIEGKSDELLRELTNHRLDLLVTNFLPSAPDSRDLYHRVVTRKNVSLFGAPKFKTLRRDFPRSVSGKPFLVPTYDSRLRYDLEHWSKTTGITVDVVAESQDIAVKELMAARGLGLMPTSSPAVARALAAGELVEIGELRGVFEEIFLVTARRKIENPVAAQLMKNFEI